MLITVVLTFVFLQLGESDFAAQARTLGGRLAQQAQAGARTAQEGFNKFVEGGPESRTTRDAPLDESKKAFWDDFASAADQRKSTGSSIGTSAMGKGPSGGASGAGGAAAAKKDEWDDW